MQFTRNVFTLLSFKNYMGFTVTGWGEERLFAYFV